MRIIYNPHTYFYDLLYLIVKERADDTAIHVFIINSTGRSPVLKEGNCSSLQKKLF